MFQKKLVMKSNLEKLIVHSTEFHCKIMNNTFKTIVCLMVVMFFLYLNSYCWCWLDSTCVSEHGVAILVLVRPSFNLSLLIAGSCVFSCNGMVLNAHHDGILVVVWIW